jgi:hypothetical protein
MDTIWVWGIHALFVFIARHCRNTNTKLKQVRRGTYGFKFQEAGPRAGQLKGCAIHWSRGNAVLQCQQVSFRARAGPRRCVCPAENIRDSGSRSFRSGPGRARRSSPNKNVQDFSSKIVEKNPVKMWKNLDMTPMTVVGASNEKREERREGERADQRGGACVCVGQIKHQSQNDRDLD